MATKLQLVSELAHKTAMDVTHDPEIWMRFLDTASRMYKYSFDDQILIYAQRADATACATMNLWNTRMSRWVKAGTSSISLIHKNNGRPYLEHVFDVSDTRPVEGAKTPWLWELREEHRAAVMDGLERRYGSGVSADFGARLMEVARRAADEVYADHFADIAYDTYGSRLERQDNRTVRARFRRVMTISVQYSILARCGLNPANYIHPNDLNEIRDFNAPAVLHHLGDAVSAVSESMLTEIGRIIRNYELQKQRESRENNPEKGVAIGDGIGYNADRGRFNNVNHESEKERGNDYGGARTDAGGEIRPDVHEGGGLLLPESGAGRGRGRNAAGQIRTPAADVPPRASSRDVHVHAPDRTADAAPARNRQAVPGARGQHGGGVETSERRGRGDEGPRPDGLAGSREQLHPTGRGNRTGGNRVPVSEAKPDGVPKANVKPEAKPNQARRQAADVESAASVLPKTQSPDIKPKPVETVAATENAANDTRTITESAVNDTSTVAESASDAPPMPTFRLFPPLPSPEEQIETIAAINEEERRAEAAQIGMDIPGLTVPEDVIGRALSGGSGKKRSVERIIAFFQTNPDAERAAAFLEKEFGENYRGVTIDGKKYALGFDGEGFHIAQGDSVRVTDAAVVSWRQAASMVSGLLRDGKFVSQKQIDAARPNEFRELSESLWHIRQNFSEEATAAGYLRSIEEAYRARFPEGTLQIAELLKNPEKRAQIAAELREYAAACEKNADLRRFNRISSPSEALARLELTDSPLTEFHGAENLEGVKGSFITRDEIDALLRRGGPVQEGKMRIFS